MGNSEIYSNVMLWHNIVSSEKPDDVLEQEREKIRKLHQRRQESLKSLNAFESNIRYSNIAGEKTLQGTNVLSRDPILGLMSNALPQEALVSKRTNNATSADILEMNLSVVDSESSCSNEGVTEEDATHLTLEELEKAAKHVHKLLTHITHLQRNYGATQTSKSYQKQHLNRTYRQFYRSWESDIFSARSTSASGDTHSKTELLPSQPHDIQINTGTTTSCPPDHVSLSHQESQHRPHITCMPGTHKISLPRVKFGLPQTAHSVSYKNKAVPKHYCARGVERPPSGYTDAGYNDQRADESPEFERFSKQYDQLLKQRSCVEKTHTPSTPSTAEDAYRDIVDILLEQWIMPGYEKRVI
jgi:hypothetical protein